MFFIPNPYADNVHLATAVFLEMPSFEHYRAAFLEDGDLRALQLMLMQNPLTGDIIQGTGGLRKARIADSRRQKGRRGGLRFIYYWWSEQRQFWLFVLYDKDTQDDLTVVQKRQLKHMLDGELRARKTL